MPLTDRKICYLSSHKIDLILFGSLGQALQKLLYLNLGTVLGSPGVIELEYCLI